MVGDSFTKNLMLVIVFLALTPIALGTSMFALLSISISENFNPSSQVLATADTNLVNTPKAGVSVFASLPKNQASISGHANVADARVEIVRQYLERYNSPLTPYAEILVKEADNNNLDFRLTTAIAQQESNLCKKIPPGTFNCWGWGIHSRGTLGFNSYSEGIRTVSEGLRINYLDKGYKSIEEIMSKYTPLSNGSWARGVSEFIAIME